MERSLPKPARSFDPLPDVPKLELAEGSNTKDNNNNNDGGDDDDDDDPYAEVPGDNERMPDSDSDEERNGSPGDGRIPAKVPGKGASPFPPYGKVSRHGKSAESPQDEMDSDSYAEVRDIVRRGPLLLSNRERSHTDPVDPVSLGVVRDRRALTESATNMPLPEIPAAGGVPSVIIEENMMYDSIPEDRAKKSSLGSQHPSATQKEQLYESVDEMADKDLYESVPDTFAKVDSPSTPNALSTPNDSPTKMIFPDMPPMPPSSPVPNKNDQPKSDPAGKKKGLEKTLSAAQSEDGKRRFSFFSRKKTTSVSSAKPKKGEHVVESPTGSPGGMMSHSSPQHKPPPLPNIPAPPRPSEEDDEEEDTYDKVTPNFGVVVEGADALTNDTRSKSLPMSYRAGGGRPHLPLPMLPEDSGSGTVMHKRAMEGSGGQDDYDLVHISPKHDIPDDPNYDTVTVQTIAVPAPENPDPPYDKIDKQELQRFREQEMQARETMRSMSSEERDSSSSRKLSKDGIPDGESGPPPEHDEEGYAVVPEEIKIRKRTMSATHDARKKRGGGGGELSPNSIAAGYDLIRHHNGYDTVHESRSRSLSEESPQRSAQDGSGRNVEEQYASIDMVAKQDKKRRELEEVLRQQEELRAYADASPRASPRASPAPPPLPPALNPADIEDFQQPPPIPDQSEDVRELVHGELKVPQADGSDPPYAKVRTKVDNPYAEVSRPYAEVDVNWIQDRSKKEQGSRVPTASAYAQDKTLGYDVVGAESNIKEEKPYDTIDGVKAAALDEALGYDVVGVESEITEEKPYDTIDGVMKADDDVVMKADDVTGEVEQNEKPYDTIDAVMKDSPSQLEQDTPKLEPAAAGESDDVNVYDSLLPDENTEQDELVDTPRSMV